MKARRAAPARPSREGQAAKGQGGKPVAGPPRGERPDGANGALGAALLDAMKRRP